MDQSGKQMPTNGLMIHLWYCNTPAIVFSIMINSMEG